MNTFYSVPQKASRRSPRAFKQTIARWDIGGTLERKVFSDFLRGRHFFAFAFFFTSFCQIFAFV
jgi:hypothetical protein